MVLPRGCLFILITIFLSCFACGVFGDSIDIHYSSVCDHKIFAIDSIAPNDAYRFSEFIYSDCVFDPCAVVREPRDSSDDPCWLSDVGADSFGLPGIEPSFCSNTPSGRIDLTGDCIVNFEDYAVLQGNWGQQGSGLLGDFDQSQEVDFIDLIVLASWWLLPNGDCNDYPSACLPYQTSFEYSQGYVTTESANNLNAQKGWKTASGYTGLHWHEGGIQDYGPIFYCYAKLSNNTIFRREFNDAGSHHNYIRFLIGTGLGAEVKIVNENDTIAGFRFVEVDDVLGLEIYHEGQYVSTNFTYGDNYWLQLTMEVDFDSNCYELFYVQDMPWDPCIVSETIADANFPDEYSALTAVEFETADDIFAVNRLSISNYENTRQITKDISSPCYCDGPLSGSRSPVTGQIWWEMLGGYDITYCHSQYPQQYDPNYSERWFNAHNGQDAVPSPGNIGYWDTGLIPNGYYHLGLFPRDDFGWVYPTDAQQEYVGVSSELKCNTFHHVEEPDISVSWPGKIPFEVRRIFNNSRKHELKPFGYGWTDNNQITLLEDTRYYYTYLDETFLANPAGDENALAFGDIWVVYSDGSRHLFRRPYNASDNIYLPVPDDDSGAYVERDSDTGSGGEVTGIEYVLKQRDGTEWLFSIGNLDIWPDTWGYPTVGWSHTIGLNSVADRFGNTLSYVWNYEEGVPTAVSRVYSGDTEIRYQFDEEGYYTYAKLKVSGQVYRTVRYGGGQVASSRWNYMVTKAGHGVDPCGIYDNDPNAVEHITNYVYDTDTMNLRWIRYDPQWQGEGDIAIVYDGYGRVEQRSDLIDDSGTTSEYKRTNYQYRYYHPDPNNLEISNLETIANSDYKQITTIQNHHGALKSQTTVTADGCSAVDVENTYSSSHPFKPTFVTESYDGRSRYISNTYNSNGDVIIRGVYESGDNVVYTDIDYHPAYSLPVKETAYQGYNRSGNRVEKLHIYGDYDGSIDPCDGKYLVQEMVLLASDPCVWAITSYKYDEGTGLVTEKIDPCDNRTAYYYDNCGFAKWINVGQSGCERHVQRFYRDPIGQMCLKATALGGVTLNDYDGLGRLWKIRTYADPCAMDISDGAFIPSRYENADVLATTIYGYDAYGRRTYERKPTEGEITTEYTRHGKPLTVTYHRQNGLAVIEYDYDDRGLKAGEHYIDDPNITGQDWCVFYNYDCMDRLIDTIWYDYDEETVLKHTQNTYYGTGKKAFEKLTDGEYLILHTEFTYDIFDKTTSRTVAPGYDEETTTIHNYDALGNLLSIVDGRDNITHYEYDNANRKIAQYFTDDPCTTRDNATLKKEIAYYDNNQVEQVTSYDTDGSTVLADISFQYDEQNRVTQVTEDIDGVNNATTTYDYSDTGWNGYERYRVKITDAENEISYIAYDAFGRTIETLYASGDYKELSYNGDGTIATRTVFNSDDDPCYITYDYDDFGRLIETTYPDNSGSIAYTRDGFGRKLQTHDNRDAANNIGGNHTISYDLDPLGQIITIHDQNGYQIDYYYRATGQKDIIYVTDPSEDHNILYAIQHYYDKASRLSDIWDIQAGFNGAIAKFSYDENSNITQSDYYLTGNVFATPLSVNNTYNKQNQLTAYSTNSPIVTFSLGDMTIDGLGRLTDAVETLTKTNFSTITHTLDYTYDRRSQLTSASTTNIGGSTWTGQYSYHDDGNLSSRTINAGTTNFSHNADLMTAATGSESFSLDWDANGNMTTGPIAVMTYNWDNKLKTAQYDNDILDLRYDPDGNRIWKSVTTTDPNSVAGRRYIIDPVGELPQILLEIDPNVPVFDPCNWDPNCAAVAKTYVYANNRVIMQYDGDLNDGDRYFYLHDRNGSIRQLVNFIGFPVSRYTYNPYGQRAPPETQESVENPFQFTGQFYDSEIAQYYLRARQYIPQTQIFSGRDPLSGKFLKPDTLHPFLYCLNDPINRTDPTGMEGSVNEQNAAGAIAARLGTFGSSGMLMGRRIMQTLNDAINFHNMRTNLVTYAMRLGRAGEYAVQQAFKLTPSMAQIRYQVANGGYRIFDFVCNNNFLEVKNVATLRKTRQLVEMAEIAAANNGTFTIVVRVGTIIPKSVLDWALKNGVKIEQILPNP